MSISFVQVHADPQIYEVMDPKSHHFTAFSLKEGGLGFSGIAGLAIFCNRDSGNSLKIPFLSGSRSHTVHVVN